jgi:hypothetical protein
MAFIDTVITKVRMGLLFLSEITGLSPIVLVCIIFFLFLFFMLGLIIILKLRGIKKILIDTNRRMNAISIIARQQSSIPNQNSRNRFTNNTQKLNNAQEANAAFSGKDEFQRHGSKEANYKLASKNKEATNNINGGKISKSLANDWHLKSAILKLIDEVDTPLPLQDIGNKLSGEYFDGNYNLILNEIEQLEKEGLIEGTSKGGKVFFRKKA